MKAIRAALLLGAICVLYGQNVPDGQRVITTIAGGDWIFPTFPIAPTLAPLGRVAGIARDSKGNIYLADRDNCMVLKVDNSTKLLSRFAGTGGIGSTGDHGSSAIGSTFNCPAELAVDSNDVLYISDTRNNLIRAVTPSGAISTFAGSLSQGKAADGSLASAALLNAPTGLAVDQGFLYVIDSGNVRILRIGLGPNGTVQNFAGGGDQGIAENVEAVNASLDGPIALAFDSQHNLLFVDGRHVRKVSAATARITTVAGNGSDPLSSGDGGPAVSASLVQPSAVAVDSVGNIYVAEAQGLRVRRIDAKTNLIQTFIGSSDVSAGVLSGLISYPAGIAFDQNGILYVADDVDQQVLAIPQVGVRTVWAGNSNYHFSGDGPGTTTVLTAPRGVAVDSAGNIYIADTGNNRVRRLFNGSVVTIGGSGSSGSSADGLAIKFRLNQPAGIAVDSQGAVYIADTGNNAIRRITKDGTLRTLKSGLHSPSGIAVDGNGNIYVADTGISQIVKLTPDGNGGTFAGGLEGYDGDGDVAIHARFHGPTGLALDSAGSLYIADTGNHAIRKIDAAGKVSTVAGTGQSGTPADGARAATSPLNGPTAVAFDGNGNLFIADTFNYAIRKVDANGIITRVAGSGQFLSGSPGIGDGGAARSALLLTPYAVAFDASGQLLMADTGNNRIRQVLNALPTYTLQPTSFSFDVVAGGTSPAPKELDVSSAVPGLAFKIASSDSQWVSASPQVANMPAAIQVSVDSNGFTQAGTFVYHLILSADSGNPATTSIPVTVNVTIPPPTPLLGTDTAAIRLQGVQSGSDVVGQFRVLNNGTGTLNYSTKVTTANGGNWLSVSPTAGSATLAGPAQVSLTASVSGLKPGTYIGTVTVVCDASCDPKKGPTTAAVGVTVSVSPNGSIIQLSQAGLSFRAVQDSIKPASQSFGILNGGQGSMNWFATATALSGGKWLTLSQTSGIVPRPFQDVSFVDVVVDSTGLAAGTYYGTIDITATAVNRQSSLTVILTVLPPKYHLGPDVRPAGLVFTGAVGFNPPPQIIQIADTDSTVSRFQSSAIGTAFTYFPSTGPVQSGQLSVIQVNPDLTHMQPSSFENGQISVFFPDTGDHHEIAVLTVAAPTASSTAGLQPLEGGLRPLAFGCPGDLKIVFTAPTQSNFFTAVRGQPVTITVTVVDSCGNPIGPNAPAGSAQVLAGFTNKDPQITLNHIGNGVWTGTWKPVNDGGGTVQIAVGATVYGKQQVGSKTLDVTFTSNSATPLVSASAVVQSASSVAGAPIAPGSLISIYGLNLGDSTGTAPQLPLPRQLCGAQVKMGGVPLPILYCSPEQMNVQVPYDIPVDTRFEVSVQNGSTLSMPESLQVADAQPGIFTDNQQGTGQGKIYHADLVTEAAPGSPNGPAAIGEVVVIYCSGLGAVSPAVPDGSPAPSQEPLARTVNPVTVLIGGQPAEVLYSGLTGGLAGLYQVNAKVPSGIATGDGVNVIIQVGGQSSPPVTMAVH